MKKGSVVKLNSGGPEMTIKRFIGDSDSQGDKLSDFAHRQNGFKEGDPYCVWFDSSNKLKTGVFSTDMLQLIKE
jgi:uncharacterized protein YodC (DUF2158 family)